MIGKILLDVLDFQIVQVEESSPMILAGLKEAQILYSNSMKMMEKVGRELEKQTGIKLPYLSEITTFWEENASRAMKFQYEIIDYSINLGLNAAKSFHTLLADSEYGAKMRDGA